MAAEELPLRSAAVDATALCGEEVLAAPSVADGGLVYVGSDERRGGVLALSPDSAAAAAAAAATVAASTSWEVGAENERAGSPSGEDLTGRAPARRIPGGAGVCSAAWSEDISCL